MVIIDFGTIKLDSLSRKLIISNEIVVLRNKEFCLMEYFMNHVGIVLSRTRLLEEVWDQNICCATNTIDVHISSLRQKLSIFNRRELIRTVHCIGYIFSP